MPPAPAATPDRRPLLLIPLAALAAILPLILHGCSCGHDFDFHLLSWIEAATQFANGNLHPQWIYTAAWNSGEPRFVFYPPISWTLGALLGLILTHLPHITETQAWSAAPILFTWLSLTAAGLTMHRLARAFAGPNAALLAAILYLANPYMLFNAYERTAYAELLAAAWIPLLLLAILRARPTIPGIALPIALLWLTNAPAAVMGSYTLAILTLIRLATIAKRPGDTPGGPSFAVLPQRVGYSRGARTAVTRLALTSAAGTLLGLATAAFFLIPAIHQRRFIQMSLAMSFGMSIDQNFLFERTGDTPDALLHDAVLHTASTVSAILLATTALTLLLFLLSRSKKRSLNQTPRFVLISLAAIGLGIAFLLTPLSLPLWKIAPEAALLQFPWRLMSILAPTLALGIALTYDRLVPAASPRSPLILTSKALPAAFLLLAACMIEPAYRRLQQRCFQEDAPATRVAAFHSGDPVTEATDEYTPIAADNDNLGRTNPPFWLADTLDAPPPDASARPGAAPSHLTLSSPGAAFLILNRRDYPAWRATVNGRALAPRPHREDGLIALPVPAGNDTVDLTYAPSLDATEGDLASLAALLLIGFLKLRR